MKKLPLEGIRIVDYGHVVADPYGTRMLRYFGAEVIKMESFKRTDNYRFGLMRKGQKNFLREGGWNFQENNNSKKDFALDVKNPAGKEVLYKLVAEADVVTANLSSEAFHKMGIDYETLKKVKKDIIVINASGMGDFGPFKDYKSIAPIMQAVSGFTSQIGYDGEEPYGLNMVFSDYLGGAYLALAVVSALEYRRRTGKGQFIDLGQTEATVSNIGALFTNYSITGVEGKPFGNRHYYGQMAPHGCYPCKGKDEWVVIACGDEQEWQNFCQEVRAECPWVDDDLFHTMESRLKNYKLLDKKIGEWTKNFDHKTIACRLQKAGVSAGMVQNVKEVMDDEDGEFKDFLRVLDFGDDGYEPRSIKVTGDLFRVPDFPRREYTLAPSVGQDNMEIMKDILHMSDEEIAKYTEAGAFGYPQKSGRTAS